MIEKVEEILAVLRVVLLVVITTIIIIIVVELARILVAVIRHVKELDIMLQ